MAGVVSREAYFETGLDVLSDLGYGGLKLAEVCNRLGVTTGSFYHYFSGWPAYTRELVENWMKERTVLVIEFLKNEPDPRRRIDSLIQVGLELPHGAEAAIRAWSSVDPDVYDIQVQVDQQRFDIMYSVGVGDPAEPAPGADVRAMGRLPIGRTRTGHPSAGHRGAGVDRQAAHRRTRQRSIRFRSH